MNKKCYFLASMLVASGLAVGIAGAVVKFAVLEPMGLYQDKTSVSLPFILMEDDGLRYMLTHFAAEPTGEVEIPAAEPIAPTVNFLDHVLFIGDSRTCSLRDHSRIDGADYFCDVGMSVFNFDKRKITDQNFRNMNLADLLAREEYTCVTVNLGLNESGYPMESLMSAYRELLVMVQKTQPQALIVLQGVLTVGRDWAEAVPYANPENLAAINERIETLAKDHRVYYIDANERFADSEGYLPDDMTWDGCHLYAGDTVVWSQWFCETIEKIER